MSDDLTRAIAEALGHQPWCWQQFTGQKDPRVKCPCSTIREEKAERIAAALTPVIVLCKMRAFDHGYDKAMEGIEALVREARAEAWDEGWRAAREVVDIEGARVWAHQVLDGDSTNPYYGEETRDE